MDIPLVVRNQVVNLYEERSHTQRQIAHLLGISQGSVSNIVRQWIATGAVTSRRAGRMPTNRWLTDRAVRLLLRESQRDPRATARQLRDRLGDAAGHASVRTVRRYLQRNGRFAYRPRSAPSLTLHQRRRRLQWAQQHINWTEQDWSKVSCL